MAGACFSIRVQRPLAVFLERRDTRTLIVCNFPGMQTVTLI